MNPVAFTIFGIEIKWYSIMLLIGIIIGFFITLKEAKRFNISKDFVINLFFWTIIIGLIGARIYYCIFNFTYYRENITSIFKVWEGGLAIHGGLIAGLITLYIYCKKHDVDPFRMTDIVVVPLILAQAIGRWGNFFNSEAHGAATTLAHLRELKIPEFIINGMKIGNVYYEPTFFYESMFCLIGFIIFLFIRRMRYIKKGQMTCLYMMYYSTGRFFIEAMRTDSLMLGGFRMAQLVSIVLFLTGLVIFIFLARKGKYEDLYNEN